MAVGWRCDAAKGGGDRGNAASRSSIGGHTPLVSPFPKMRRHGKRNIRKIQNMFLAGMNPSFGERLTHDYRAGDFQQSSNKTFRENDESVERWSGGAVGTDPVVDGHPRDISGWPRRSTLNETDKSLILKSGNAGAEDDQMKQAVTRHFTIH